jgi:MFS family permease
MSASILFALPGGVPQAVAGLGLLGVAVAGVVPTALSSGARLAPGQTGAVAAGVLAAVYVSFMITPPSIGYLAQISSLSIAFLIVGFIGLGMFKLARDVGW